MNTLKATLYTALLATSSAYAGGLDPSATIGTGYTANSIQSASAVRGIPTSSHWSSSIGNGHTADGARPVDTESSRAVHAISAAAVVPHWSSRIGTGHAQGG